MTDVFWTDDEYDQVHASDGVSRYGHYVRSGRFEPCSDDLAVELAVYAWQSATGPVMAPGWVRHHRRIQRAHLARSDWDGSLLGAVDLYVPQPVPLRRSFHAAGPFGWRDWPAESLLAEEPRFYEPDPDQIAGGCYMLTTVSLRFTVPSASLPEPHPDGADTTTCQQAVRVLVRELNKIVGPVIAAIEAPSNG